MALIPKFMMVAAERTVATGEVIKMGQVVALDTNGEVRLQGTSYPIAYGLAGDTKSTSASAMPGIVAGWQNRASDYFDETKASGKMTVYHSGGEFATDQFHANVASVTQASPWLYAYNGLLDTQNAQSSVVVAQLTQQDGSYPSGVPGTDINGDMKLSGDNSSTYIEIKLLI